MIEKIENLPNVRIYYNKRNALKPQDFTPERQKELHNYIMENRKPDKLFSVYLDASGYRTSTGRNYWKADGAAATPAPAPTKTTARSSKSTKKTAVKLIDYSAKAFALVGDTKQFADKLKAAGGKFNPHLQCGSGWIFAKSKTSKPELLALCR